MRRSGAILACIAATLCALPALAQAPAPHATDASPWSARYDAARGAMLEGDFERSKEEFRALAALAPSNAERTLALEMARLAAAYASREPRFASPMPVRSIRSTDELTLLYVSAFLYGAGTGTWFLLEIKPDSAVTATLPFAALTAAPILGVATVDGYRRLGRGVPHAMSAGLYLGLGEAAWLVAFQHARASRIENGNPSSDVRWSPETTATVLWGGATLGATMGGLLGSALVTTPGRVSFTASTTIWSGALGGLVAGALSPDDERRSERAFAVAGLTYNAGLLGGILTAGSVSPSVTRVRIVDLIGVASALAPLGVYLSVAKDPDTRAAEGIAAIGGTVGLASAWLATSGMPREVPATESIVVNPTILPVTGGAAFGFAGTM